MDMFEKLLHSWYCMNGSLIISLFRVRSSGLLLWRVVWLLCGGPPDTVHVKFDTAP